MKFSECKWGNFINNIVICFIMKAYLMFATLPHIQECPLQHRALRHNEMRMLECLCPLCTKEIVIEY